MQVGAVRCFGSRVRFNRYWGLYSSCLGRISMDNNSAKNNFNLCILVLDIDCCLVHNRANKENSMAINYREILEDAYSEADELILDQLVADGIISASDINRAARTIVQEEELLSAESAPSYNEMVAERNRDLF